MITYCRLESDGQWRSFALSVASPKLLSLQRISSPLRLVGLSFIGSPSDATSTHQNSRAVSIISLDASLVLLCGSVTHSQDLVLLLWDLRYSVVLASHRFSIPAKLSALKGGVSLELIPALSTLVLLSITPGPLDKSSKTSSAVLVVPVTAPATSTIANAMGRASSSAKWLAKPDSMSNGPSPIATFSPDCRNLLGRLKAAMQQNDPEAADSAFSEWLKSRSGSSSAVDTQPVKPVNILFGHEFVREILSVILQSPSKSASPLYPVKTVYHLLEMRVVSASMLSQSLLGLFAESKDWVRTPIISRGTCTQPPFLGQRAVNLTFKNVPDLPEAEMIKLLRSVHKGSQSSNSLDAHIDVGSSDTQTLPTILAACVSYPTSDAALRMAIREQLNHAEAVLPILVILDDWLAKLSSLGTGLSLDANVVPARPVSREVEIPPLDKVCQKPFTEYLY